MLPMAAAVIVFCLCICPIAAPSISLEGKYLWILRESPIEESSLHWIKVGFQLLKFYFHYRLFSRNPPEIREATGKSYKKVYEDAAGKLLESVDLSVFRPGVEVGML